jgi:hypothetical protein
VLAALRGQPDAAADELLQRAEGRTVAAALADLERREILYPFVQTVEGIPVEFSGVLVSRRAGRSVGALRGAVLGHWRVANARGLDPDRARRDAVDAVGKLPRLSDPRPDDAPPPALVLLPYGRDGAGLALLRHAWRVHVTAQLGRVPAPVVAWIDAETRTLLKLHPLLGSVAAEGLAWTRDPRDPPQVAPFVVDPTSGGNYVLQLAGAFRRLDFRDDGYNGQDVGISATTFGSTPSLAQFVQPPLDQAAAAKCASQGNHSFQQVHLFATLSKLRERVLAQGIFEPFPPDPWLVTVEEQDPANPAGTLCTAWSSMGAMQFGACDGYYDPACPGHVGPDAWQSQLNFAHDVTMVAHELGHNVTKRLTELRPADWCGVPPCDWVRGWDPFEDLADFWAAHLTSTNCIGGWVAKNAGGLDHGLDCLGGHDANDRLPRRLEAALGSAPGQPNDHFPEKRQSLATCSIYCDGQTAAAALWEVRLGMRSRFRLLGVPQFGVYVQGALRMTGLSQDLILPPYDDRKIYRMIQELLRELTLAYAGSSTPFATHEVTAGFARAGLFLAPAHCIQDGAPPPGTCGPADRGGDAVIDVDDNVTADDPVIARVSQPETDFIAPGGPGPTFVVWTGPRYRFSPATGQALLTGSAPCHRTFRVEVSTDPTFPAAATVTSGWKNVTTNATNPKACQGSWKATLPAGARAVPKTRLYYRVRTRDKPGGFEHVSTRPGGGLAEVPPPFLLVTVDGRPPY